MTTIPLRAKTNKGLKRPNSQEQIICVGVENLRSNPNTTSMFDQRYKDKLYHFTVTLDFWISAPRLNHAENWINNETAEKLLELGAGVSDAKVKLVKPE